jgi:hypothetical protein
VADEGAGAGGGGLKRGDAGDDVEGDAGCGGVEVAAVEKFAGERAHGVDAGVARGDERHVAALAGERQRLADAGFLGAEGKAVLGLAGREMGDEVEVEVVADPVGGGGQGGGGGGAEPFAAAGADADDAELAARAAGEVDERGRAFGEAQVARGERVFSTTRWLCGPAAASAAPSATPGQPTSRSTTSEGLARRGDSSARRAAVKKRAGTRVRWRARGRRARRT